MLRADTLTCIRGDRLVFTGLSFVLERGEALRLTGPNGSGKSSLIRMLAGFLRPAEGALYWDGAPIALDRDAHTARLAYIGHDDAVKPWLSVRENLAFWGAMGGQPAARVDAALTRVGLGEIAGLPARILSAGQRRRLALARLLLSDAPLWLMDEPTTALDAAATAMIEDAIAAHCANGGLAVVATHLPVSLAKTVEITLEAAL